MRKLIAGMKVSVDSKMEGPDGMADWVDAWSNDYDLLPRIDACLLGAGMYPGYEGYWSSIQNDPEQPLWLGKPASAAEREWARFAARTPHYVLSRSLPSAQWPHTRLLRGVDEVAALKRQTGKDIYLVGGARTTASLIDEGLVDELRLIVYPLIVGDGKGLFATTKRRRALELLGAEPLPGGLLRMTYGIPAG